MEQDKVYIGGIKSFLWPPANKKSTGVYRKKLSETRNAVKQIVLYYSTSLKYLSILLLL